MPLDESARRLLEMLANAGAVPIQDAPDIAAARTAATNNIRAAGLEPPDGVMARDEIGGACQVRIYRPEAAGDAILPLVVFAHGGGWVLGDLDSHDHLCRHLALGAECAVIAVDYRLAPEHPFPAAYEDLVEVLGWVAREANRLRVDPERIALCGDSAGGNLVAAAALHPRDDGRPDPVLQILLYPVCDLAAASDSYRRNGSGYVLPVPTMAYFIEAYVPDLANRFDPRASPLRSDGLAASPPTILYTAEYDILHDEGLAFVTALQAAGVEAKHREVHGQMHAFLTMGKLLPIAAEVVAEMVTDLQKAFYPRRKCHQIISQPQAIGRSAESATGCHGERSRPGRELAPRF